ncbi:hypothetical protein PGT21_036040 [Puccinia graminis f. sp. tritici]|uniref:Uncharacterized protein n=1 Tax=Puccinia graminis f. sp. tritici TaxID=56615 RepID=A0A5B0NQU2_PUCGR|nr:hypothetical protein PGT21_036040 [Puccinia graminis f. sp. tritici]
MFHHKFLFFIAVFCLRKTQSVKLNQVSHAENEDLTGREMPADMDQLDLGQIQNQSNQIIAQHNNQLNQFEKVQDLENSSHPSQFNEAQLQYDEIHQDFFGSQENEAKNNEIERNIKLISSIPPLNKGTKFGLAKNYVKHPDNKKAKKMLMETMQEEFKVLEEELGDLFENSDVQLKHARKIKAIQNQIKLYIQNWILLQPHTKGLEIQPSASILDDGYCRWGEVYELTLNLKVYMKHEFEDLISKLGIKSRRFLKGGYNSPKVTRLKVKLQRTNLPEDVSKNVFIPQEIHQLIMKHLIRNLPQVLLSLNENIRCFIKNADFMRFQRLSFQTADFLYRYELLSVDDFKNLFKTNETIEYAAYNMIMSFAYFHEESCYWRPLNVKAILDSWYSSPFRNIYEVLENPKKNYFWYSALKFAFKYHLKKNRHKEEWEKNLNWKSFFDKLFEKDIFFMHWNKNLLKIFTHKNQKMLKN